MKKWSRRDKALLLENLEMYISAGLNLHDAISTVGKAFSKKEAECLRSIQISIEQGQTLSKAFENNINLSSALLGLIEHGESSGNLPQALGLARTIIEREDALIKSCMSALAYPSIIGIFACVLTIGLMRGVMPQIIPLLKSLHVELPLITKIVIYSSENIGIFSLYILILSVFVFPASFFAYKKFFNFKLICHKLIILTPLIGNLFRQYNLSIFSRSLGGLLSAGANISYSYKQVTQRIILLPIRVYLSKQIEFISQGVSLASIFKKLDQIPSYVVPLIQASEASGTLGRSLIRISDILDRDIENSLKKLTALIEPIMMIGIGVVIGGIALSIMMPIYDISRALQH